MASEAPTPSQRTGPEDDLGEVLREYMEVTNRLQNTHEALQGEVVRLRDELETKDRELELRRRLSALGELAAGVAHEVRNPLGAIQLYNDLLRSQCRQLKLDPALQLVEKIEAGIQAIDAVVKDTLALAPRDRAMGACHVPTLIAKAQDASLKTLTSREVELAVSCDDNEAFVRGDQNGLQRVLVNLIVNAAEVSPPRRTVRVTVGTVGDTIEVRVSDEGPGIPDDVRERIFDPFFTTKDHGTGLGLTIAHRLVEAYGGRLAVENQPTGGAEFTVTLMRADPADVTDGRAAASGKTSAA